MYVVPQTIGVIPVRSVTPDSLDIERYRTLEGLLTSRDNRRMVVNDPHADSTVDHVDEIVQQWTAERPDVDVSGMAVIGRLTRLERAIRPRLNEVFAAHDLESWEFDVLATLRRNGEPHQLTPGQLLDSMMITSGAMTNRIDRLERRGYVRRSPDPTDKRQVLVTLTAAGHDKVDAALVDHAANELALIEALKPDQRDQLVELLRLLGNSVRATPHTDNDER
jgi:DNA-binding MarR family transcriptional regulator